MAKKEFTIIRHGQTEYNLAGRYMGRLDIPLADVGRRKIKKISNQIEPHQVIFTSPLQRTVETALIINQRLKIDIEANYALVERSLGVYEGLTKDQANEIYPDLYKAIITQQYDQCPPGGETINSVISRVHSFLDDLVEDKNYQKIMIVTHGFVIKIIHKYFHPEMCDGEFFRFYLRNGEIKKYSIK